MAHQPMLYQTHLITLRINQHPVLLEVKSMTQLLQLAYLQSNQLVNRIAVQHNIGLLVESSHP